ncbi:MAG TPA: murein L,D-transpeptidase catalytic domain family protein, partial [Flavobacterium sp.]|nr:murein L,D-transpeptidase catalytic domain family protein [Flavobacterium sp.]
MQKLSLIILLSFVCCQNTIHEVPINYNSFHQEALTFCKQNKFNQDFYFFVDLSIHSGKNRFFIYDFKNQKVVNQNLVTH